MMDCHFVHWFEARLKMKKKTLKFIHIYQETIWEEWKGVGTWEDLITYGKSKEY